MLAYGINDEGEEKGSDLLCFLARLVVANEAGAAITHVERPIVGKEEHLRHRGLTIPGGDAIRFHPKMPWWNTEAKRLELVPCMVAPMRHIHTDELRAIH